MSTRARSISFIAISAVAVLVGAGAPPLAAQSALPKDTLAGDSVSPGAAARQATVAAFPRDSVNVTGLRSPLAAGLLDLVVPIAGHAYAGRWTRGIPSAAVTLASAAVAFAAAGQCTGDLIGGMFTLDLESDPCAGEVRTFNVALVVLAASRVWGAVSAAHTADAHNRRILESTTVHIVPRGNGAVVAMTVRW